MKNILSNHSLCLAACSILLALIQATAAAEALVPDKGEALLTRLRDLARKHQWEEITKTFEKNDFSSLPPVEAGEAFYLRGQAYAALKNPANADRDLTRATKCSPDNETYCLTLGEYSRDTLKDNEKALAAFRAAPVSPGRWSYYSAVLAAADILFKQKKYDAALKHLDSAGGGVGAIVNNGEIEAIIIESKSGRQAIRGKIFVDGTGDGDVAWFGGCAFSKGRPGDGRTLSMGSRFRMGGLRRRAPAEFKKCEEITRRGIAQGKLECMNESDFVDNGSSLRETDSCPDITRCGGDGTSVRDLTRCEVEIRKQTLNIVNFMRARVPGFEKSFLIDSPAQVGVRETRQIHGRYMLTTEDVLNVRKFPESTVARGCWFLDMHCCMGYHHPGPFKDAICSVDCRVKAPCILKTNKYRHLAPRTSYLPQGEYYDIPYGCLVAKDLKNLLVSGRCISASHEAMSSVRVIGTCFAIGEAAGLAAALSLKQKVNPDRLDVGKLQKELRKSGVPL